VISLRRLSWCALVLSLVPAFASGDEPSLADRAQRRVEDALVKPLAQLESHTFSRSRPPPRERRVRILQTTATPDRNGHPFVPFAIDVRFGSEEWHENDIVGCAYTGSGKLYVKRGDAYRPASFLLGKNEDVVAGVCVPTGTTS
jgi:hypothetical protein